MGLPLALSELVDGRGKNVRYDGCAVVMATICAYMCQRDSVDGAHRFVMDLPDEALAALGFSHRRLVPRRAQFHNILSQIDADSLSECLSRVSLPEGEPSCLPQLAIDGKRLRASRRGDKRGVHLIGAFCASLRVVRGQERMAEGENEVTAALRLLKRLDIKDKMVSFDAIYTQPEVIKTVQEGGGHYVMPVKGNQPELKRKIEAAFQAEEAGALSPSG